MQDGIFNRGKRTQGTGYISTKHIYLYNTYVGKTIKTQSYKETKAITYTGKQKQEKALRPNISNHLQALKQFYLRTRRHQHSFKSPKEKDPLTDKGVRLDRLGLYDTGPGRPNGSRETVAGYLHPRGASVVGELSPALSC